MVVPRAHVTGCHVKNPKISCSCRQTKGQGSKYSTQNTHTVFVDSHTTVKYLSAMTYEFRVKAENLPVMDSFLEGASADPYFKMTVNGQDEILYTSEVIKVTLSPNFATFTVSQKRISDSSPSTTEIKLAFYDSDNLSKDDFIGDCVFRVKDKTGPDSFKQAVPLRNVAEKAGSEAPAVFIKVRNLAKM